MKVCIYGAGAVGGEVAVRLLAGTAAEVSVVARGAHLAAIRERGLTLRTSDSETTVHPAAATDDPASLPAQDLVAVALKSHSLPAHAERIAALLKPEACAVFVTNGIPWWWNHGLSGAGGPLPLLDPDGSLWKHLVRRSLACVVYTSDAVISPGVVMHRGHNRWLIGEPDNAQSPRLAAVVGLLQQAGLDAWAEPDIRREIWKKLFVNAGLGPACALTRLPVNEARGDPVLRPVLVGLVRETMAVAAACGWDLDGETDVRAITEPDASGLGILPSMLQDVLARRAMEVEGLLGQTQAFARERGVATPVTDVVLPLLRGLDQSTQQLP